MRGEKAAARRAWVHRIASSALAFAFVAGVARGAAAAEPSGAALDEARKHYARGVALYEQGAYPAALAEVERAYDLAPSWQLFYDLGLIELAMDDFAAARRSFQRYLDEGGTKVPPARRADLEARVRSLAAFVATLVVKVDEAGANVTVDDVSVGTSPLAEPVMVNAGRHAIAATKEGRSATPRVVSVAGGDEVDVDLVVGDHRAAPTPPPPAPAVPRPIPVAPPATAAASARPAARPIPPAAYVAGAASATALGFFGGFAIAGLGKRSALASRCAPFCDRADGDVVRRDFVAADVALGVAVLAAGAATYFYLTRPEVRERAAAIRVHVAPAYGGVVLGLGGEL